MIPDTVLNAMHQASPDIYGKEITQLVDSVLQDLKAVARTTGHATIYICNGHGVWEASLTNLFSPGDHILVLETGIFAHWWGRYAQSFGIEVERIDFGPRNSVDADCVAERLTEDTSGSIKAILVAQVDTASSVLNDIPAVSEAIKAANHPALLMVDCIASLACEEFRMDEWNVDVALAASQKGLMMAPGLGFLFCNSRAFEISRSAELRTPYWDWQPRIEAEAFYQIFAGTVPAQQIFGLSESLNMIVRQEGLDAAIRRHHNLAQAIWAAVDEWGSGGTLEFNIENAANRSHAVTTLRTGASSASQLRNWVSENAGLSLGVDLLSGPDDPTGEGVFRIGHMGHVNPHMILGALASIEAGFETIAFPRGKGAVEAAAAKLAERL